MDNAQSYFRKIAPAAEGLFKLLNAYGWHKINAIVGMHQAASRVDFETRKHEFTSTDVAREVIAGSILQIAYFAIKHHGVFKGKSPNTLHFESEINRLIQEIPNARAKKRFLLPEQFCLGREVGHLPIGVVIYAGRHQYNHFDELRLGVLNEVVFDHLRQVFPNPANGLSFDVQNAGRPLSYSILSALGWIDLPEALGYEPFEKDLKEMLQIEA